MLSSRSSTFEQVSVQFNKEVVLQLLQLLKPHGVHEICFLQHHARGLVDYGHAAH